MAWHYWKQLAICLWFHWETCHLPPYSIIIQKKKMSKKEEREDGGRGQMTVIKCKNDVKSRSGLVVVARITPSHEVKARHYQLNPSVFCRWCILLSMIIDVGLERSLWYESKTQRSQGNLYFKGVLVKGLDLKQRELAYT